MASFEIHGPFKIDYEIKPAGRYLDFDDFWSKGSEAEYLAKERFSSVRYQDRGRIAAHLCREGH